MTPMFFCLLDIIKKQSIITFGNFPVIQTERTEGMKNSKWIRMTAALAVGALVLAGCGTKTADTKKPEAEKKTETTKKVVYTSFYPMYDFAKKVAGDKMDIRNVVPVGQEPHDYELTTQDRKNFEHADAIIYNGAGMEEWVDDVRDAMKDSKVKFIKASEGITLREGHHHHHHDEDAKDEHDHDHATDVKKDEHDHDHDHATEAKDAHDHATDAKEEEHEHEGEYDPHVWLSPENAKKEMENIKNAFVALDPANADTYKKNYEDNAKKFDELDAEYKKELKPYKGRHIIVAHEAFGYLCANYGLEQVGIEGLSPDSEPSPKKMAEIVEFAKKNDIKTVFYEELVSPKVSEAVAKEAGAKTSMLNPLEGLSQKEIDEGKDYVSVMKSNLKNLLDAFQNK